MSVVINGSAGVTTNSGAVYDSLQRGTAVASTSGTSVDFTSIPSWVKRITVMFNGVSLSGSAHLLIQLGVSNTPTTSGYISFSAAAAGTNTVVSTSSTAGFVVYDGNAANLIYTTTTIVNLTGNSWNASVGGIITSGFAASGGGVVTLGGAMNMVRITTTNGTDTFDAGTINIIYE